MIDMMHDPAFSSFVIGRLGVPVNREAYVTLTFQIYTVKNHVARQTVHTSLSS